LKKLLCTTAKNHWHKILLHYQKHFMSINVNDPSRNRPSNEGFGNDPNLRDDSAAQPGISTMSGSDTDYSNEETTQSVSDIPETSDFDDDADEDLDEEDFDVDEEDDDDDEA